MEYTTDGEGRQGPDVEKIKNRRVLESLRQTLLIFGIEPEVGDIAEPSAEDVRTLREQLLRPVQDGGGPR